MNMLKSGVQVFNPDGKFSHTIGQGELKRPRAVAIDSNGNIHATSLDLYNPSLCMKEACHSIFSQNSPPLSLLYIMLVFVSYLQVLPVDPNCQ